MVAAVLRAALLLAIASSLSGESLRYWVEPCTRADTGCRENDTELAVWALEAWQSASAGTLKLEKTNERGKAHIRIHWAGAHEGLYGEARPILVDGKQGAEVYVRPLIVGPAESDALLRDAVVYLTCVHESGHALGLAHTAAFADIMYSVQYGGDLKEYFGRYRRLLTKRADIRKHTGMSDEDRSRLRSIYTTSQ